MKISRILSALLLSMGCTAQAALLNAANPTLQLGVGADYRVNTSTNLMVKNSPVDGDTLTLKQSVVSSDATTGLTIVGTSYLTSGHTGACDVFYAQGTQLEGKVIVSTLDNQVVDEAGTVLVQGSVGVVLELTDGARLSDGQIGQFGLVGEPIVFTDAGGVTEYYFGSAVDKLRISGGKTATLKDTKAYVEFGLEIDGATLVLDNAELVLGDGDTRTNTGEFSLINSAGDKTSVVIQTGKDAMEKLDLVVRPVENGTIRGTGRLENVMMHGGALEIGTAGAYGTLAIKDVVMLTKGMESPRWTFNINASGDFNFTGANLVGGTNFSQLKVEAYGNHGQNVSVVFNYQNGLADNLSCKFTRGSSIRLIDLQYGALSGTCHFTQDNLPELAEGLSWYTQELFLTGDIVVVDSYLNDMAIGLISDDGEGYPQIRLADLEKVALNNQSKDAERLSNTLAAAAAATSAFGHMAVGHADDVRRWKSNLWFSGVYSSLNQDATGSHAGYDSNVFGYAVGMDTYLNKYNAVVGAALGRTLGTVKPTSGNSYYTAGEIDQDGVQLGVYARTSFGGQGYAERGYTVEGFICYGMYDCESSRDGRVVADHVVGCWDETAWSMGLTVSREYQWQHGVVVTPFAGFEYTTADMENLREMGYTAFDYTCIQEHRNLAVFAGAKAHRVFQLQRGQSLVPFARVSLGMDVFRQYAKVRGSSMAGSVEGEAAHPGRCSLQMGLGTDWIISRTWSADIGYSLEMRDAAVKQQLHVGASHSF